jgi:hypothetical protein
VLAEKERFGFRASASHCLRRPKGAPQSRKDLRGEEEQRSDRESRSEAQGCEGYIACDDEACHENTGQANASYAKGTTDVELRSTY